MQPIVYNTKRRQEPILSGRFDDDRGRLVIVQVLNGQLRQFTAGYIGVISLDRPAPLDLLGKLFRPRQHCIEPIDVGADAVLYPGEARTESPFQFILADAVL